MSTDNDRLTACLEAWNATLPQDQRVPASDIEAVARARSTAIGLTPAGMQWTEALAHIVKQVSFGGTVDSVLRNPPPVLLPRASSPAAPGSGGDTGGSDLHERLRGLREQMGGGDTTVPTPETPAVDGSGIVTRRFTAMSELREKLIAAGHPVIGRLSVSYQRALANSDAWTAEDIRGSRQFPGTVKELADELAEALAPLRPAERPASPPTPPPSAAAAPAPPPSTPAPTGVTVASAAGSDADLAGLAFAAYNGSVAPGEIGRIDAVRAPDGGQMLSWPAVGGAPTVIHRVVRGDQHSPYNPDAAAVVAVTGGTRALDDVPFPHAVRHYQVWTHRGNDVADAAMNQPVLTALGVVISPPVDVTIVPDSGMVTGTWETLPGTERVCVYRVPVEKAFGAGIGAPQYRIHADRPLLGGFSDDAATPGRAYVYQVLSEASVVNEIHTSGVGLHEVSVPDVHKPVTDLRFALREHENGDASFELTWTDPSGGRVVIYRTTEPPAAGYDLRPIVRDALPSAGLLPEDRLAHPLDREGAEASMRSVPWPREWTRAFFTAVVELGDEAYVGNTVVGVRVGPVARPKMIERVDHVLLTFDFPQGAREVRIFSGPPGMDAAAVAGSAPLAVVSRQEYDAVGSVRLGQQLIPEQCDLHLVAHASHGQETARSVPVTVRHIPVLVMDYRVSFARGLTAASRRPKLSIRCSRDLSLDPGIGFVLGYHPERLPLTVSDCTSVIALVPDTDEQVAPQQRVVVSRLVTSGHDEPGWKADAASWASAVQGSGFVRLFVDEPRYQPYVALLDPALGDLRAGGLLR